MLGINSSLNILHFSIRSLKVFREQKRGEFFYIRPVAVPVFHHVLYAVCFKKKKRGETTLQKFSKLCGLLISRKKRDLNSVPEYTSQIEVSFTSSVISVVIGIYNPGQQGMSEL